jgi:hypothetical protein
MAPLSILKRRYGGKSMAERSAKHLANYFFFGNHALHPCIQYHAGASEAATIKMMAWKKMTN